MSLSALLPIALYSLSSPAAAQEAPEPAPEPAAAPAATPATPAPAKTEAVIDEQTKNKARRFARKARKALENEQWDQALGQLDQAIGLWPLPHLQLDVATAHLGKGDLHAAWSAVLKAQDGAQDDKAKATADAAAEEVRFLLSEEYGEIVVSTKPPNARVVLTAGEETLEARAPFRQWIKAGRWSIAVAADDYEPQKGQFTLAAGGEVRQTVALTSRSSIAQAKAATAAKKKAKSDAEAAAQTEKEARASRIEAKRVAAALARQQATIDAHRATALYVLAGGLAVLGGGVFLGLLASESADELDDLKGSPRRRAVIDDVYDKANTTTRASNALLTVGVGVVGAGGWLLFTAADGVQQVVAVPGVLALRGSF